MNELQIELLQLKANTYDAIKQIEICKYVISQNTLRIEEIEKELREGNDAPLDTVTEEKRIEDSE